MGSGEDDPDGPGDTLERDEPIAELRGLGLEPKAGFNDRLRHRIERREVSSQLLWFSWHLPAAILLAFIEMAFAVFRSNPSDNGGVK